MAFIDTVKTSLRIRHTALDDEIERIAEAGRQELVRLGIPSSVAEGDDPLVEQAVVTYCHLNFTDDKGDAERYQRAFEIQADGIRNHQAYREEDS